MASWLNFARKKSSEHPGLVGVSCDQQGLAIAYIIDGKIQHCNYIAPGELAAYVTEHGLKDHICSYVLDRSEYTFTTIEYPNLPASESQDAIRCLISDLIDYPVEQAICDSFPLPIKRARDDVRLGYVAAIKESLMYQKNKFINKSGLKLRYLDIPEMLMLNLANLVAEISKGCVFITMHSTWVTLVFCNTNIIHYARSIEIKLDELQAMNSGVLEDLALQIQRSQDHCTSLFRQVIANVVILAPSELATAETGEKLSNALGMPVHRLDLNMQLKSDQPIPAAEQDKCLMAVGAALREIDKHNAAN